MTSKAEVLLLREPTPSSDSGQDRYEAAFTAAKYMPFSIPVLETVLTNITELALITEQSDFDGVIMTSARSSEAWDKANGTGKDGTCRIHLRTKSCSHSHGQNFPSMLSERLLPRRYVPA